MDAKVKKRSNCAFRNSRIHSSEFSGAMDINQGSLNPNKMVFSVSIFFNFDALGKCRGRFDEVLVFFHWNHCLNHGSLLEVVAASFHCSKRAIMSSKIIVKNHVCHDLILVILFGEVTLKK